MIGDDAHGDVVVGIGAVLGVGDRAKSPPGAAGKDRYRSCCRFALQNGRDAFKSHACIDGRGGKRGHFAGSVAVELHEDQIPDLDPAAAGAGQIAVAVIRQRADAEVVMKFRAGPAGAGFAHRPEVVFFSEPEDLFRGDADLPYARYRRLRRPRGRR